MEPRNHLVEEGLLGAGLLCFGREGFERRRVFWCIEERLFGGIDEAILFVESLPDRCAHESRILFAILRQIHKHAVFVIFTIPHARLVIILDAPLHAILRLCWDFSHLLRLKE